MKPRSRLLWSAALPLALAACGAATGLSTTRDANPQDASAPPDARPDGAAPDAQCPSCPPSGGFRVVSLDTRCVLSANHEPNSGDDRGGLVVAQGAFFYSGDGLTLTGSADSLRFGTGGAAIVDGLVADLLGDRAYGLTDEQGLQPGVGFGPRATQLTRLRQLNLTGDLTDVTVRLAQPLPVSSQLQGVYSGRGFFLLYSDLDPTFSSPGTWFHVAVPSGQVTSLGRHPAPPGAQTCESWANWGLAEFFDGAFHVVYARRALQGGPQGIYRYHLATEAAEPLLQRGTVGDVCMLAASVSLSRWYFHFELPPDFVSSPDEGEHVVSCPAVFALE